MRRLLSSSLLSWAVSFGATLGTLRYLVPSRMDGGEAGLVAWFARQGDEHPLYLGVALFFLFSEMASYWRRRWARGPTEGAVPRPSGTRSVAVLGLVVVVALVVRASVAEVYRVVSASMVPTLNVGDRLLVNRMAYGLRLPFSSRVLGAIPPRRGDVVVFSGESLPVSGAGPKALVKRVVGLPGDVVEFRDGSPIINGWAVPACDAGPFASTAGTVTARGRLAVEFLEDQAYLTVRTPLDDTRLLPYEVPPGEVFVIGDDRGQSSDSRAWNDGQGRGVPVIDIVGRVSRLAGGGRRDGRVDLSQVLRPLRPKVREPNVDLRKTEELVAACLAHPPRSTRPPPRRTRAAGVSLETATTTVKPVW
jgi:signal peptidase I